MFSSNKYTKIIFIVVIFVLVGTIVYVKNFRGKNEVVESVPKVEVVEKNVFEVIGKSTQGRNIEATSYGKGEKKLLFVGGIHGGYEWNTVLLAQKFMDYFTNNPSVIPANISVTIIPSLNPDGVYKAIGKEGNFTISDALAATSTTEGRFNANRVDLNRNFDCNWKPEASWRGQKVSSGSSPFSEKESQVFREYILKNKFDAVVFWHSQADTIYASYCNEGILPQTTNIMNAYALASGYKTAKVFTAYEVTGDAEGWLASIGIPAVTVELKTHDEIEWEKNLAGVRALFNLYIKP